MGILRWNAVRSGWFGETDEATIFVSEATYEQCLKEYFASKGIERKTWRQIMQPAEDAWHRQLEVERLFQENLDYWLTCKEGGVKISWHEGSSHGEDEEILADIHVHKA